MRLLSVCKKKNKGYCCKKLIWLKMGFDLKKINIGKYYIFMGFIL